jgi:hypothetical protein
LRASSSPGIAIADDSTRGLVAAFALAWLALILDQSHKKDAYEQLAATHRLRAGHPHEDKPTVIINADARRLPLVDHCVQCVVTSPPYFGLRDYGTTGQIGLELTRTPTWRNLVAVFPRTVAGAEAGGDMRAESRDSYANDTKWGGQTSGKHAEALHGKTPLVRAQRSTGLKSKDLIGVPWRVAFALQADGWYLRSDIIWSKPNPDA